MCEKLTQQQSGQCLVKILSMRKSLQNITTNAMIAANFVASQCNTDKDLEPPTIAGFIFITKAHSMWLT